MKGKVYVMRDELSLDLVRLTAKKERGMQQTTRQAGERMRTVQQRATQQRESRFDDVKYGKRTTHQEMRRRRRKRRMVKRFLIRLCITIVVGLCLIWTGKQILENKRVENVVKEGLSWLQGGAKGNGISHPEWTEDFLTVNEYSRPGTKLYQVKDIFVHYTANPGTNAAQNRSYFEQLKDTHERAASAHFIIGYEGEIIQCVPLNEIAYAVKTRNHDSMSIECCYINEDGSFTQETYDSLIELLVWMLREYDLTTDNILRHYDCGGKKCPLYYTENEAAWEQLKQDVQTRLEE